MTSHPSRTEEGEFDDPYVHQLGNCAALYQRLEACLAEHDRDWRRCQYLVKALQVCQTQNSFKESKSQK